MSDIINDCSQLSTVDEVVVWKSSHIWTIRNFRADLIKDVKALDSPIFSMGPGQEFKWQLSLDCVSSNNHDILCVRASLIAGKDVDADYSIAILDEDRKSSRYGSLATLQSEGKGRRAVAAVAVDYLTQFASILLARNEFSIRCNICARLDPIPCKLSSDLGYLLENGNFSDVTLIVEGRTLPAHKSILASRSLVFAAMFQHDVIENEKNVIEIMDVPVEAMKELLKFVYTDKTDRLDELALDLFEAADKYALDDLKIMCEYALCSQLNIDNVLAIMVFADLHNSSSLKNIAEKFIVQHAEELTKTKAYKAIGAEHLHLLAGLLPRIE